MHQSSGRWKLGLVLALTTATLWGILPIPLKGLLTNINAVTITWYRFAFSATVVAIILYRNDNLPTIRGFKNPKTGLLSVLVIFGLSGNYILYLLGLNLVTPSAAQIVIQLAPLLLLLGGIAAFKESFSLIQWLGVLIFLTGLGLFFNQRFNLIFSSTTNINLQSSNGYVWGLILVGFAAITWAAYALAQKQLLLKYNSQQIMFIVYIAATVLFFPSAEVLSVATLSSIQWGLLLFCCLNTVIAYGCFAEALAHWEASRVASVLAITPLMTIIFAYLTNQFFPQYIEIESINWISLVGAGILVMGSLTAALAGKKNEERATD